MAFSSLGFFDTLIVPVPKFKSILSILINTLKGKPDGKVESMPILQVNKLLRQNEGFNS